MVVRKHLRKWVATLWMIASIQICLGGEIEATLDRDSVLAGQGAQLTLRISGSPDGRPQFPEIENFIVEPKGQNQEFRIINGVTSRAVTYRYAVGSQIPGDYVVPSISMKVDGQEVSTKPLELKVLPKDAARPPAGGASQQPQEEETDPIEEAERFGFLTVELLKGERKHVFVGEIAPVKIEAWIPAEGQAQVRSGIQPEGQAFTLHNVSDRPSQTTKVRDGRRYIVVTWYGGISATKAGRNPVSLSLEATVSVRDTSAARRKRPRMGGAFDDPFFDDIFDRMRVPMIQKNVTLASKDEEIEVRLLPEEGKPDGFAGAVGNFAMAGSTIPEDWRTGEPQSVEASVTGTGNFALLSEPRLTPAEGWKVYAGKSDFTPGDVASFSGKKDFRFSAVPAKGGSRELALELSYFDPDEGAYKTVSSPAREVQILGEDIVFTEEPVAVEEQAEETDQLVGQHDLVSGFRSSLIPLVERPMFVGLLGGSGLLGLAGIGLMVARVRRENPERIADAELKKSTQDALALANQAANDGDPVEFFRAGRRALQLRLAAIWEVSAEGIASADVESRLGGGSEAVMFFQESDRQSYSSSKSGDFPKWQTMLDKALNSLNTATLE